MSYLHQGKQLLRSTVSSQVSALYLLHAINDGYQASLLLFLPFIAHDLQLNLTQAGLLGTVVNSLSIVLAFPSGYIAAKFGGMRTLIIALFLYGLGFLGSGFSTGYLSLFPMFIIAGLGLGVFHPIGFALIARWTDKEDRGRVMGNFTAIGDIGKIGIAAFLTVIIVSIGWRFTSLIYAVLALGVAGVLYVTFLKQHESLRTKEKIGQYIPLAEILRHKPFIFAVLSSFFDSFASSSLFIFLPFLLLKRGVSPALLGTFSAAFFIGNFAGKTVLGRFVDKYGNSKIFIVSELLMALFIITLANSTNFIIIIVCSVILGIFTKGTVPVLQTMISESADHHGNFEKTFAIASLVASTASTIAPVLLGIVSDKLTIIAAFNVMAGAALLAVIPAACFGIIKKQRREHI
jgi:FSR family fosmidomycin resistance protein-like MFS transporter